MKPLGALALLVCLSFAKGEEDVRLPPSVTKGPVKSVVYRSDDQVTLDCKGNGVPAVGYEWKKNGFDLNLNRENIKKGADGTITIQPATSMDEGYYQCYVTNQYGTAVSVTSHLQRAVLEASSGTPTTVHKMVKQGEPFHVQAVQKKSHPRPTYGWEIARDTVDKNPTSLKPTKRMQIADNGDLYFSYALPEDDLQGRIYKSTTYNPYLDLKAGGDYTNVTVTRVPGEIPKFLPSLQFSSDPITTTVVGATAYLRCIYGGYPDSSVSWRGPDNRLPVGRIKYDNEKYNTELTITNISLTDQGDYTCVANNPMGNSQHTLQLLVEAVPSFKAETDGPYDVNVTETNDITFNCMPDAKPEATITWLENGKPIDTNSPPKRFAFSNGKKSLTIKSVCRDCTDREKGTDLTVIQCNASNTHGYIFRSGYINVLKKTEVVPSDQTTITVETNEDRQFDFPCTARSDPSTPPSAIWYRLNDRKEEQLFHEDPPYVTIKDGTLTIRASPNTTKDWKHYHGEYHCVASNGYSKATHVVMLTVKDYEPPLPPGTVASIADWWWLFLLIALIIIILILILCCCLYLQRNKGDKYDVDEKERKNGNDPEKELMAGGFQDYQRPEGQTLRGSRGSLGSSVKLNSDEEGSLNEYGDDPGKFTEDGSFVGAYTGTTDRKKGRAQ